MAKRVALALCLAVLAAGTIFSVLRIVALTDRVQELEGLLRQRQPVQQAQPESRPIRVAPPDGSRHQVLSVTDGDTFAIATDSGSVKVRVIGIDTPETVHPAKPVEPFGPEASCRAKELLGGKTVRIHYDPAPGHDRWGRYGRLLAYVELPDGGDYGLVMVREGLARAYVKYPCSREKEYLKAESAARKARVGLWAVATTRPGHAP